MPVTHTAPDPLFGLNGRELEVLRLLAMGHTAKTIAAQLGCSETAINERLRDARRKSGVGSSRELARQLAARKTWDKKIDLSSGNASRDSTQRPAHPEPIRSKGRTIMFIASTGAAAALLALAAPAYQQAAENTAVSAPSTRQPSLIGRWALDTARIPEAERPKSVTMTFQLASDGKWTTIVDVVAPDGSTRHAESAATADGVGVPVAGNMANIDSVAFRHPTPDSLVMTLAKSGRPVSTRVYTVSKDQRSMTETIIWAGRQVPKLETTYFNRID